MPNALIYSPGFDGHRQVYVYVISHFLTEMKYNIFLARNFKEKVSDTSYINRINQNNNITLIDTSIYPKNGLEIAISDIIKLQNKYNIELTFFAEADNHISLFNSQIYSKKNRLRGKIIGIFLRPFYYYEKLSFVGKLSYIKHLIYNWRSDERLFFEILLKYFKLLDSALCIDENFVSHHTSFNWLPDVFQQYTDNLIKDENPEQRVWIDKLNVFKENNKDKFIFLYFGTAQKRRGYDLLLKMSVELDACFIHCGLNDFNERFEYNVDELKAILHDKGRLLETNQYISDPLCIAHFFKIINYMVLPYSDFFGSSGVMLQALSYGIPVLVHENGLMGNRVKKHHLGLTYNGDYSVLLEQFEKFRNLSKSLFTDDISHYMQNQSTLRLEETLINAIKE